MERTGSNHFKSFDELTFADDFMFSIVMRDKDLCSKCLELVLGRKVKEISYIEPQKSIDFSYDAKSIRMDVFLEGEDEVYDIEMQNAPTGNLGKRSRYYHSMIDMNILEKGEEYNNLKKSVVIFFCRFDPFGKGHRIYRFKSLEESEQMLPLKDGIETIFLNTKGMSDNVSEGLMNLLDFIERNVVKDNYTKELMTRVEETKKRKEWRQNYMTIGAMIEEEKKQSYAEGKIEVIADLVSSGDITIEKAILRYGVSAEEINKHL